MRTKLLLLNFFSFAFFISNPSHAQVNVIKIDLISPLSHKFKIAFEHSFHPKLSGQITFETGRFAYMDNYYPNEYSVWGSGLSPEIRFYPLSGKNTAPLGFFVGGSLRYFRFKENFILIHTRSGEIYNVGLNAGYKFKIKQFSVEANVGLGLGQLKIKNEENYGYLPYNPDYFNLEELLRSEKNFVRIEILAGYSFKTTKIDPAKPLTPFAFGLKGGVNINNTSYKNLPEGHTDGSNSQAGFHVGMYFQIKLLKNFSFMPEFQFIRKGYSFEEYNTTQHLQLDYVEWPFLFSYRLIPKLNVEAGPVVGIILLNGRKLRDGEHPSYTNNSYLMSRDELYTNTALDYGLTGGLRFNISNELALSCRYYRGLNDISTLYHDQNQISGVNTRESNNNFQISTYLKLIK